MYGSRHWTGWVKALPEGHWPTYRRALAVALAAGRPFALGGAFATATHTGVWRGTNDMDLYVLPADREASIAMLDGVGLQNVQQQWPYDPSMTYRASDGNVIVELIWGMKNHRALVDEPWLGRAERIDIDGVNLPVTAPEEMIWPKLYVLSRERCDWPDILNLLHFCGAGLDWRHLMTRVGDDRPLLAGALCVLQWLSPERFRDLPAWIFRELGLDRQAADADFPALQRRAELLNANDWFGERFSEDTTLKQPTLIQDKEC